MQESVIINHPPPAEKGDRNHYLGLLFYACVLRFALRRCDRKIARRSKFTSISVR